MGVRSGQTITTEFTTRNPYTLAAADADSLPTGTLYVNGTANGATVTITNQATGVYKAAVTLPTLAVNDVVSVVIAATVAGVTDSHKVWEGIKDVFAGAIPDAAAGAANGLALVGSQMDLVNAPNATAIAAINSAVLTAITNLNNLSALINLYGSPLLEIPDSGSTVFAFTVVVRDNEGKLVDLDSSPTIAAANAAGTDRSANLSAVSNPSTGRYTFTYSVASSAVSESLRITVSGTVSAEDRYIEWIGAVVDYDTLTTLNNVDTNVTTILGRIIGTLASGTHNPQSGDAFARLGAPAGASVSADIAAVKSDTAAVLADTGTDGVVVASGSKSGYSLGESGLDAISTTAPSGAASNFREMIVQLWRRFFKKSTLTSTQLKTYADDGTTVVTTQTVSDDGTTQTQGAA